MSGSFETLERLTGSHDESGMLELVASFPSHMKDAWERGAEFAAGVKKAPASQIVVCGMGGSAIGGDMVRSFLGDRLELPLLVNRSFTVPASFVSGGLFIFSSYSGNTGETLSAYRSVRGSGRPMFAITSGGELADLCEEDGVPVCRIPGGMPPRAAIAYSFFPLTHVLSALGVTSVSDDERDEALEKLGTLCGLYRSDDPANRAAELAYLLEGKLPLVYSGSGLLEAVARRWSTQLNENSKSLAHFATLPELTHNEIVGWHALDELRDNMFVVRLDDAEDDATARKQADIAMEIIEPHAAGTATVLEDEGSRLTRILSCMILGDFVSVYLAFLNGVDPTPVRNIDILKQRLRDDG
jgi:glucose/mannose-6-phosphate isomerase